MAKISVRTKVFAMGAFYWSTVKGTVVGSFFGQNKNVGDFHSSNQLVVLFSP